MGELPPKDGTLDVRMIREAERHLLEEKRAAEAAERRLKIAEHYRKQGHAGGYGGTHNPNGCTPTICLCDGGNPPGGNSLGGYALL